MSGTFPEPDITSTIFVSSEILFESINCKIEIDVNILLNEPIFKSEFVSGTSPKEALYTSFPEVTIDISPPGIFALESCPIIYFSISFS